MHDPYRLLIVDDDESIRTALSVLLEEEGYVVDTAGDGREAMEKSNANFYNMAIVDWRLPDIEGTALLGKFRNTTPKMIMIMLTGFPSMRNAIDSVNAKADAYLQKPMDAETLIDTVSKLLKQQEEDRTYSETKVAEFIETRARELTGKIAVQNPRKQQGAGSDHVSSF